MTKYKKEKSIDKMSSSKFQSDTNPCLHQNMAQVFVGDAHLNLAKAKKLASSMGGAWHDEEDVESELEQHGGCSSSKAEEAPPSPVKSKTTEGFLGLTVYRKKSASGNNNKSSSKHGMDSGKKGSGRAKRRPADGKAPGRRDPEAVARMEAEAKLAAERVQKEGTDRSWLLPTNVDYYTDRAALLRELVKEMPADKRLSFQTRVANACTKEAVEGVLLDYATRLECLVLPHARSRDVDLHQVKKDTARERVLFDGKEVPKKDPSEPPHAWHEELWATVEERIMEGLLESEPHAAEVARTGSRGASERVGTVVPTGRGVEGGAAVVVDKARALANEEWKKMRAVAATGEVFKAMSRTGAGGDAYFALVALFCTADKLVVPVACQESPIEVDFLHQQRQRQKGRAKKGKDCSGGRGVHVMVTVPSTFDIYLQGGQADERGSVQMKKRASAGGGGSVLGGASSSSSVGSRKKNPGEAAADASIALHLVRVRAVVEEEIWVMGSDKRSPAGPSFPALSRKSSGCSGRGAGLPSGDDMPPPLQLLMEQAQEEQKNSAGLGSAADGEAGALPSRANNGLASQANATNTATTPPLLALTRAERRIRVSLVPEPSVVSEMVRNFSRTLGVDVPSPEPPRVLGM